MAVVPSVVGRLSSGVGTRVTRLSSVVIGQRSYRAHGLRDTVNGTHPRVV